MPSVSPQCITSPDGKTSLKIEVEAYTIDNIAIDAS